MKNLKFSDHDIKNKLYIKSYIISHLFHLFVEFIYNKMTQIILHWLHYKSAFLPLLNFLPTLYSHYRWI